MPMTFPNIDALEVYVDAFIKENHNQEITGDIANIAFNGCIEFIRQSPLNYSKATVESSGGVVTAATGVTVFITTTPTSLTWGDNVYNEWVFVNLTGSAIPLAGSLVYYDIVGKPTSAIPPFCVVYLFKSTNDLWIQGNNIASNIPPDPHDTGILSGGEVIWSGSGLTFNISAATYLIGGAFYSYPGGSLTLNAADPTLPRIDVIGFDSTGAIKITGTPAASPQEPTINPLTQIRRTIISILANATTPAGITQTVIYDENLGTPTEWATATTGTVNFNNLVDPYHLTKAALVTALSTSQNISFTAVAPVYSADYNVLALFVRLVNTMGSDVSLNIQLFSGVSPVSSTLPLVNYGLSPVTVGSYQIIIIPMGDFGATSISFDKIVITKTGASATPNLYIDYIQFQSGISSIITRRERFGLEDNFATGVRMFNLNENTLHLIGGGTLGSHEQQLRLDNDVPGTGASFNGYRSSNNESEFWINVFRAGFDVTRIRVTNLGQMAITPDDYLDLDGYLNMLGSTSGVVSVKTQAVAGTYNFNLPITAGSAGQVLTSQGGGSNAMTWSNAGAGTVASFSAGNLSPLFTTSVATATTTPALTFALTNAAGGTVFGNNTGSSAAPAYTAVPVLGIAGTTKGTLGFAGNTSGVVTIQPQAAAGTFNFNLPITAGTAGQALLSGGGGSAAMTWGTPTVTLQSVVNAGSSASKTNLGVMLLTGNGTVAGGSVLEIQNNYINGYGISIDNNTAGSAGAMTIRNNFLDALGLFIVNGDFGGGTGISIVNNSTSGGDMGLAITNTYDQSNGLLIQNGVSTTNNSYGLRIENATGSTAIPFKITKNGSPILSFIDAGRLSIGSSTSPTAWLQLSAGVTGGAQLRLEPGVAPSAPNDGDIYYINTNDRLMFFKNATASEIIATSSVNSVSPTSPNRTLTVLLGGTTYYIAAKTSND